MSIEDKQIEKKENIIKYFEENVLNNIVTIKKKKDQLTGNIIFFPSVEITEIMKLNLTEDQNNKIFNYLTENGITIIDKTKQIDQNIEDYNYFSTYKQMILPTPLTQEEINQKFALLKLTNDPVIREQLILNGLHIVPIISQKYAKEYGLDQYEVESYGYEAIINAVDNYNYTKGTSFLAYAKKSVIRTIIRGIPELEYLKNTTFTLYETIKKQEKQANENKEENIDIAEKITDYLIQTGVFSGKKRKDNLTKIRFLLTISLEELSENENEIISNKNEINNVEKSLLKTTLKDLIKILPQKEQVVITEKYGLNDGIEKNYNEIAEILNLSEQRVKQLETKALVKLRYKSKKMIPNSIYELEDSGEDTLEEYHNTYKKR